MKVYIKYDDGLHVVGVGFIASSTEPNEMKAIEHLKKLEQVHIEIGSIFRREPVAGSDDTVYFGL
jgi:hypothetical protein